MGCCQLSTGLQLLQHCVQYGSALCACLAAEAQQLLLHLDAQPLARRELYFALQLLGVQRDLLLDPLGKGDGRICRFAARRFLLGLREPLARGSELSINLALLLAQRFPCRLNPFLLGLLLFPLAKVLIPPAPPFLLSFFSLFAGLLLFGADNLALVRVDPRHVHTHRRGRSGGLSAAHVPHEVDTTKRPRHLPKRAPLELLLRSGQELCEVFNLSPRGRGLLSQVAPQACKMGPGCLSSIRDIIKMPLIDGGRLGSCARFVTLSDQGINSCELLPR